MKLELWSSGSRSGWDQARSQNSSEQRRSTAPCTGRHLKFTRKLGFGQSSPMISTLTQSLKVKINKQSPHLSGSGRKQRNQHTQDVCQLAFLLSAQICYPADVPEVQKSPETPSSGLGVLWIYVEATLEREMEWSRWKNKTTT